MKEVQEHSLPSRSSGTPPCNDKINGDVESQKQRTPNEIDRRPLGSLCLNSPLSALPCGARAEQNRALEPNVHHLQPRHIVNEPSGQATTKAQPGKKRKKRVGDSHIAAANKRATYWNRRYLKSEVSRTKARMDCLGLFETNRQLRVELLVMKGSLHEEKTLRMQLEAKVARLQRDLTTAREKAQRLQRAKNNRLRKRLNPEVALSATTSVQRERKASEASAENSSHTPVGDAKSQSKPHPSGNDIDYGGSNGRANDLKNASNEAEEDINMQTCASVAHVAATAETSLRDHLGNNDDLKFTIRPRHSNFSKEPVESGDDSIPSGKIDVALGGSHEGLDAPAKETASHDQRAEAATTEPKSPRFSSYVAREETAEIVVPTLSGNPGDPNLETATGDTKLENATKLPTTTQFSLDEERGDTTEVVVPQAEEHTTIASPRSNDGIDGGSPQAHKSTRENSLVGIDGESDGPRTHGTPIESANEELADVVAQRESEVQEEQVTKEDSAKSNFPTSDESDGTTPKSPQLPEVEQEDAEIAALEVEEQEMQNYVSNNDTACNGASTEEIIGASLGTSESSTAEFSTRDDEKKVEATPAPPTPPQRLLEADKEGVSAVVVPQEGIEAGEGLQSNTRTANSNEATTNEDSNGERIGGSPRASHFRDDRSAAGDNQNVEASLDADEEAVTVEVAQACNSEGEKNVESNTTDDIPGDDGVDESLRGLEDQLPARHNQIVETVSITSREHRESTGAEQEMIAEVNAPQVPQVEKEIDANSTQTGTDSVKAEDACDSRTSDGHFDETTAEPRVSMEPTEGAEGGELAPPHTQDKEAKDDGRLRVDPCVEIDSAGHERSDELQSDEATTSDESFESNAVKSVGHGEEEFVGIDSSPNVRLDSNHEVDGIHAKKEAAADWNNSTQNRNSLDTAATDEKGENGPLTAGSQGSCHISAALPEKAAKDLEQEELAEACVNQFVGESGSVGIDDAVDETGCNKIDRDQAEEGHTVSIPVNNESECGEEINSSDDVSSKHELEKTNDATKRETEKQSTTAKLDVGCADVVAPYVSTRKGRGKKRALTFGGEGPTVQSPRNRRHTGGDNSTEGDASSATWLKCLGTSAYSTDSGDGPVNTVVPPNDDDPLSEHSIRLSVSTHGTDNNNDSRSEGLQDESDKARSGSSIDTDSRNHQEDCTDIENSPKKKHAGSRGNDDNTTCFGSNADSSCANETKGNEQTFTTSASTTAVDDEECNVSQLSKVDQGSNLDVDQTGSISSNVDRKSDDCAGSSPKHSEDQQGDNETNHKVLVGPKVDSYSSIGSEKKKSKQMTSSHGNEANDYDERNDDVDQPSPRDDTPSPKESGIPSKFVDSPTLDANIKEQIGKRTSAHDDSQMMSSFVTMRRRGRNTRQSFNSASDESSIFPLMHSPGSSFMDDQAGHVDGQGVFGDDRETEDRDFSELESDGHVLRERNSFGASSRADLGERRHSDELGKSFLSESTISSAGDSFSNRSNASPEGGLRFSFGNGSVGPNTNPGKGRRRTTRKRLSVMPATEDYISSSSQSNNLSTLSSPSSLESPKRMSSSLSYSLTPDRFRRQTMQNFAEEEDEREDAQESNARKRRTTMAPGGVYDSFRAPQLKKSRRPRRKAV